MSTPTDDREHGVIDVGTTTLYREVRGSGPPVLFITGGTGDAGEWEGVAPTLARDFTVVTYDRRAMSRSPRPAGWTATSVAEQADDAAGLLRALDLPPAVVVGHSAGGSIACELVVRHPAAVRHAVIYEPPLPAVLHDGEQIVAGMRGVIDQAMAEGGPRRAMEMFIRANAGDEVAAHFAASDPARFERALANGAVFFPIELPVFATFVPDRQRMRAGGVPLTVVVGAENGDTWYGAAAAWLADGSGAELHELPGAHGGFVEDPDGLLALVHRVAGGAR